MLPLIQTIPLCQLASGDRLSLQLYRFVGGQPGKKIYLQSNLHGAEIAGNLVIDQLIKWLMTIDPSQLNGELWLVPACNPLGTNQRSHHFSSGRFNPYDGQDWNRIFWDYSKSGADILAFARSHLDLDPATIQHHYRQQIQQGFNREIAALARPQSAPLSDHYRSRLQALCLDADYVIDLHTSADQGIDYLYYFRDRQASAPYFQLSAAILLDEYDGDAFDEAFIKPWLALEDCFTQLGRPLHFDIEAWTLELGSAMQIRPELVTKGVQGIQNYLAHKGVLAMPPSSPPPLKFAAHSQVTRYYAPVGGMVHPRVELGAIVKTGQRLYQVVSFNKETQLPTEVDVHAEQDGLVFDLSLNQAVSQGEYVLRTIPVQRAAG